MPLILCIINTDFFLQVNTFPLDYKVESVADLNDGFVLSKILGMCILMTPLRYPDTFKGAQANTFL
jgi:hypothetical protein